MKKDKVTDSRFTPELEQSIRDDIKKCQEALENTPLKTRLLYRTISDKYLQLYPHLCDGIPSMLKRYGHFDDYSQELTMVVGALQGILLVKTEPMQQNQVPSITIGKVLNKKGNIGNNDNLTNHTEVDTKIQAQYKPKN